MKNNLIAVLISSCVILFTQVALGQRVTLQELLDETVALSKSGKTNELAESLKSGSIALQSEANTRGNEMKEKLLRQSTILKDFAPLAAEGNLKTDVLIKAVNTTKLVIGATHINNLLTIGKEGLLGNAKSLANSLALLQAGMPALETRQQGKLKDLITAANENVQKLDGQDAVAKMAASAVKRTLGKIVDIIKESV